jgi:hypothetical protein
VLDLAVLMRPIPAFLVPVVWSAGEVPVSFGSWRRSAVLIDLARGYAMRRMDAAAFNTLLDAEQIAAEAVRFNVLVHELLRELRSGSTAPPHHIFDRSLSAPACSPASFGRGR